MVSKVNKKLSERPVGDDAQEIATYINRELAPLVSRLRLTLDALLSRITEGQGSPEGVIAADKAALYLNQTGTVGSLVYVKTTDTVATGWVVLL